MRETEAAPYYRMVPARLHLSADALVVQLLFPRLPHASRSRATGSGSWLEATAVMRAAAASATSLLLV